MVAIAGIGGISTKSPNDKLRIQNWYKSSKVDYIPSFIKLWVSFNSWYDFVLTPKPKSDQEAIYRLKSHTKLQDNLNQKLLAASDEGKELRKALSILIEETTLQPLINRRGKNVYFAKSNVTNRIKSSYEKEVTTAVGTSKFEEFVNNNDCISLNSNIILTNKTEIILDELLEVLYQIRCMLFHGSAEIDSVRTERLVKNGYGCLSIIFDGI